MMQVHEIKGQCVAKRAFEVAAVGGLRVLLVGPLGSSKTTLRKAFPEVDSAECETCPCGHFRDRGRQCICSARLITRWHRRLERVARDYDIVLECSPTPTWELMSTPDSQENSMWQRVAMARAFGETHKSMDIVDDGARCVMGMAARRLALTAGQYNRILHVARAIANLDVSDVLLARHVAEAVQYRADATIYRVDQVLACLGKEEMKNERITVR